MFSLDSPSAPRLLTESFQKLSFSSFSEKTTKNHNHNRSRNRSTANCDAATDNDNDDKLTIQSFVWHNGLKHPCDQPDQLLPILGTKQWADGSLYEGELRDSTLHGHGEHKWPSGEVYGGDFFLGYRHGFGEYTWPNGNRYNGMFYMDQRQGYGKLYYDDGRVFSGLYYKDVRFGPGIQIHPDASEDVGLWDGSKLIRVTANIVPPISLDEFRSLPFDRDDHVLLLSAQSVHKKCPVLSEVKGLECTAVLLDKVLFRENSQDASGPKPEAQAPAWNYSPYVMRLQQHVIRYKPWQDQLEISVDVILRGDRQRTTPKGPLECSAEEFLSAATAGDMSTMDMLLRKSSVHPDIADCLGNATLLSVSLGGRHGLINLLLDNGADINRLNDEGLSALAACLLRFYPVLEFIWTIPDPLHPPPPPTPQPESDASSEPAPTEDAKPKSAEAPQPRPSTSKSRINSDMEEVIRLLLRRGADPNATYLPVPCLFMAVLARDVEMVHLMVEKGAHCNASLGATHGTFTPLHFAVALPGKEGVEITRLLLDSLANPNARATIDASYLEELLYEEAKNDPIDDATKSRLGGRTPLHIASARTDDHVSSARIVELLLNRSADVTLLCNGHSPLSLAIASGNDQAVDLLLRHHADPRQPLPYGLGNALCVASHPANEPRRSPDARTALIKKLVAHGADVLAPVLVGQRRQRGSALDYVYYIFNQDRRIAHMPYHALTVAEREVYNARKKLMEYMADLVRQRARQLDLEDRGTPDLESSVSSARLRRAMMRMCYTCGRSVAVKLTPCSRCKAVAFCSNTCKTKGWNDGHREECNSIRRGLSGSPDRQKKPVQPKKADANAALNQRGAQGKAGLSAKPGPGSTGKDYSLNPDHESTENYSYN